MTYKLINTFLDPLVGAVFSLWVLNPQLPFQLKFWTWYCVYWAIAATVAITIKGIEQDLKEAKEDFKYLHQKLNELLDRQ